jgi:hypothetical protein
LNEREQDLLTIKLRFNRLAFRPMNSDCHTVPRDQKLPRSVKC